MPGSGAWYVITLDAALAVELLLDGVHADGAVALDNEPHPPIGCTDCAPTWTSPTQPTVRFARQAHLGLQSDGCATIVSGSGGEAPRRRARSAPAARGQGVPVRLRVAARGLARRRMQRDVAVRADRP